MADEYWNIDIPGLTRDQALDLENRLRSEFEFGVIVTDPADFMVRGFDRSSVEALLACAKLASDSEHFNRQFPYGVDRLIEDFEDWLKQANEVG
jgi:hypothetical protein